MLKNKLRIAAGVFYFFLVTHPSLADPISKAYKRAQAAGMAAAIYCNKIYKSSQHSLVTKEVKRFLKDDLDQETQVWLASKQGLKTTLWIDSFSDNKCNIDTTKFTDKGDELITLTLTQTERNKLLVKRSEAVDWKARTRCSTKAGILAEASSMDVLDNLLTKNKLFDLRQWLTSETAEKAVAYTLQTLDPSTCTSINFKDDNALDKYFDNLALIIGSDIKATKEAFYIDLNEQSEARLNEFIIKYEKAMELAQTGKYNEAISKLEKLSEKARIAKNDLSEIIVESSMAKIYLYSLKDYSTARKKIDKAVNIAKNIDNYKGDLLLDLVQTQYRAYDIDIKHLEDEKIPYQRQARLLAIQENIKGYAAFARKDQISRLVSQLVSLGNKYIDLEQIDKALDTYLMAIKIINGDKSTANQLGIEAMHPEKNMAINEQFVNYQIAYVYIMIKDKEIKNAKKFIERAIHLAKNQRPLTSKDKDDLLVYKELYLLGLVNSDASVSDDNIAKALLLSEDIYNLSSTLFGATSNKTIASLIKLAKLQGKAGKISLANNTALQALKIVKGTDTIEEIDAYLLLIEGKQDIGKMAYYASRIEKLADKIVINDDKLIEVKLVLALCYTGIGNKKRALEYANSISKQIKSKYGNESREMNLLSSILRLTGETADIIDIDAESEEDEAPLLTAFTLLSQFDELNKKRDYKEILKVSTKATSIYLKNNILLDSLYVTAQTFKAHALSKLGMHQKSVVVLENALQISERINSSETISINQVSAKLALAGTYLSLDMPEKAIKAAEDGLELQTQYLYQSMMLLPARQRNYLASHVNSQYQQVSAYGLNSTRVANALLKARLNRKGFLAEIEKEQVEKNRIGEVGIKISKEINILTNQLSSVSVTPANRERLYRERDRLEQELYTLLPVKRRDSVEINTVASLIETDGILLEFQTYFPAMSTNIEELRYLVYIVDNNSLVFTVDLGSAKVIDGLISLSLQELESSSPKAQQTLQLLSGKIISPIEKYLKGKNIIYISPDSEINRVPFSALSLEGKSLIKTKELRLITTGREIISINQNNSQNIERSFVVSNPDFDLGVSNTNSGYQTVRSKPVEWSALPGTKKEGEAILEIIDADLVTSKDATVDALKATKNKKIIHIATHAYYLSNIDQPSIELGQYVRGLNLSRSSNLNEAFRDSNPLLRSGIVLAGANKATEARENISTTEDGYLTALEISVLPWEGTELVVISACDSGLGDIQAGEGVYGLKRAIAVAGSKSSLLSLWKVDDSATAAFMKRFYEQLAKGINRNRALANVQLEFQKHPIPGWRHPNVWAAFQLSGDWRPIKFD